jgi:hypothetical protein
MSWETCPKLPAGTVIKGAGTGESITKTTTDPDRITTAFNSTIAPGKPHLYVRDSSARQGTGAASHRLGSGA